MFPTISLISPLLNAAGKAVSRYEIEQNLPVLAVHWFQNVERISKGALRLKFDPIKAIEEIHTDPRGSDIARSVIIANCRWNIIWGQYCLELLKPVRRYYFLKSQFEGMTRRNTNYLAILEEKPVPTPGFELIKASGVTGFDLIVGDIAGNTYTDSVWHDLVGGLDVFTSFRSRYVQLTNNPGPGEESAALMAKAIALAEISWSREMFAFRDGPLTFESLWRIYFQTGLYENLVRAANIAGAGLPQLTSAEIIRRMKMNPDMPIEDVLK